MPKKLKVVLEFEYNKDDISDIKFIDITTIPAGKPSNKHLKPRHPFEGELTFSDPTVCYSQGGVLRCITW
ncbi:MAG TPA: hypothetical protein VMW81_00545 [Nitrospinota bacterium]|nr:hypothetical protein [Nitrospinota bacterium]